MSINKNGVIVDPGGYIFEQAESLIEKFYRFVLRLPNTQPLLFQIGGCEPRSILDGGKDNRAWYATHMFVCFYPSGEDFGSKFLAAEDFHIISTGTHSDHLVIWPGDANKKVSSGWCTWRSCGAGEAVRGRLQVPFFARLGECSIFRGLAG